MGVAPMSLNSPSPSPPRVDTNELAREPDFAPGRSPLPAGGGSPKDPVRDFNRRDTYRDDHYDRRERPVRANTTLYIGNLPIDITAQELEEKFKEFGTITSCSIPHDPHTKDNRSFGFVCFADEQSCDDAITHYAANNPNGYRVEKSRRGAPREPTPGRYLGRDRVRSYGVFSFFLIFCLFFLILFRFWHRSKRSPRQI